MNSRAVRNCNPLNIRRSNDKWQGLAARQTDPAFCVFTSDLYGFRASFVILRNYIRKCYNSVFAIVNRWAPPSDNNPTSKYVNYVCTHVGISPSEIVFFQDKKLMCEIVYYMAVFESGCHYDRNTIAKAYDMVL